MPAASTYAETPPASPAEAPVQMLLEIVRRYGTPTYAYDLECIRSQVAKLRGDLPPAVEILYSLKANASLGLCGFIAGCGLGADVASAGELLTAVEAGFPPDRIFVSGPDISPGMLAQLRSVTAAIVSTSKSATSTATLWPRCCSAGAAAIRFCRSRTRSPKTTIKGSSNSPPQLGTAFR